MSLNRSRKAWTLLPRDDMFPAWKSHFPRPKKQWTRMILAINHLYRTLRCILATFILFGKLLLSLHLRHPSPFWTGRKDAIRLFTVIVVKRSQHYCTLDIHTFHFLLSRFVHHFVCFFCFRYTLGLGIVNTDFNPSSQSTWQFNIFWRLISCGCFYFCW